MVSHCEVAVIGGGVVGLATALSLSERGHPGVVVLEAEARIAAHQSGHNSGVIHSGLYYKPGSLKAQTCRDGREALYRFCEREKIAHRRCGKLVVATSPAELPMLDELERRGRANGLEHLRRLGASELHSVEPEVAGLAGLWVPETGVVDYVDVAEAYARLVCAAGGEVRTAARVTRVERDGARSRLDSRAGALVADLVVNCAGLQADRVARLCGSRPPARIVPFRGEYWELAAGARDQVRGLIYPVPDARFPFLGVHLTRTVDGRVEAGPNAVLAWRREGYRRGSFAPRDALEILTWPGFWRFAGRHWRTGLREAWRAAVPGVLARDLRRLVPALTRADLHRGGSGVRAMELDREGRLIDDFHILAEGRAVHVLNAPSPAATASIAIGERIAEAAVAALREAGPS